VGTSQVERSLLVHSARRPSHRTLAIAPFRSPTGDLVLLQIDRHDRLLARGIVRSWLSTRPGSSSTSWDLRTGQLDTLLRDAPGRWSRGVHRAPWRSRRRRGVVLVAVDDRSWWLAECDVPDNEQSVGQARDALRGVIAEDLALGAASTTRPSPSSSVMRRGNRS
jgi:hypothetical protein